MTKLLIYRRHLAGMSRDVKYPSIKTAPTLMLETQDTLKNEGLRETRIFYTKDEATFAVLKNEGLMVNENFNYKESAISIMTKDDINGNTEE